MLIHFLTRIKLKVNLFLGYWIYILLSTEAENKIDFAVGGQAVVEGVMMRSPNNIAISVRKTDGTIKVKSKPYHTLTQRYKILNIPILRGVINLFEMMYVGTDAINFSATESLPEEENEKETSKLFNGILFAISMIFALALSIFLFKFTPLLLTSLLEKKFSFIKDNYIFFNLLDGIFKMLIFLSYLYLLTQWKDFRRIFEYHGAEHKSIFNYERNTELSPKNAKKESRFHPRCGTSFVLIVFTISILVYTFVPKQESFWSNLGLRLAFLPLIAGISYEYLKLSAKFANNFLVKALITPGLLFQKLTTKEPDEKQLEVAIKSLKTVLEMESTPK
jgi:uncharacterized protein YqhQ